MTATEGGNTGISDYFADLLGAPELAIRLLFSLFAGYPLALFHRHVLFGTAPIVQHVFFTICGITLGFYNYGFDIFHSILCVLIMYLILVTVGGEFCSVVISFLFFMGYLLTAYYYTATDEYDMNWTTPQCILTLRLIGLTWDVYDGQKSEENLSEEQKKTALKRCPSLLEIGGHAYFFGGFLVSPQFPMKRYLNLVEGKFKEKILNGNPDCVTIGLQRLAQGILVLSLYKIGSIFVPENIFFFNEFVEFPYWKKILIIVVCGKLFLYKYAAIWIISEGSLILTGLTYNGTDKSGKDLWDGCTNVKLWYFTTTSTPQGIIRSYNCSTNLWVGQYVYKRLKFLGNRYISQAAALLFLAAWHGWHSGYYVCFFNEFIFLFFGKDFESFLTTRFPKVKEILLQSALKYPVRIFLKVYTNIMSGYIIVPIIFLSWSRYMQVYRSVYFFGYILLGWLLVSPILRVLIPKAKDKKAE
ncbi:Lysophospholipid acyltransferase 5 [Araneus ventricosus]|uniref:Lysophospholipid acyltransferase 5 n=1 Tax=Araneus ventricosus TaxID=182803 RepID=A0A4Y2C662_ARAVE|nr:Lysophospholipid acyltransferase 5 [Araneus ventricosus]